MEDSLEKGKIEFLNSLEIVKDYKIMEIFQETWQLSILNNIAAKKIIKKPSK